MPFIFVAIVLYLVFAVLVGALCTDYVIWAIAGQDISFFGDVLISIFAASITIPAAICLWLFEAFGGVLPLT